jgi:hypothetical protein
VRHRPKHAATCKNVKIISEKILTSIEALKKKKSEFKFYDDFYNDKVLF